jgi:hypothetical protein
MPALGSKNGKSSKDETVETADGLFEFDALDAGTLIRCATIWKYRPFLEGRGHDVPVSTFLKSMQNGVPPADRY